MEIIHGDIKPSNIMVNQKTKIAKLTDFGFGLLPGETGTRREEYPETSYHTPKGLSPKESDNYKLGRTLQPTFRRSS
jgi:serine/threonine protein kinase